MAGRADATAIEAAERPTLDFARGSPDKVSVDIVWPHIAILAFVTMQRIGELGLARANTAALLACAVAVAVASLAWPLLAPGSGTWPALAIWGGASGAIYTLGMVRAVQLFAGPARAIGMAGLNTAYLLGGATGAPLAGLMLEGGPGWGLPVALAVIALGGGAMLAWAMRSRT